MAEIEMKMMNQYISTKVKASLTQNLMENKHFVQKNSIYGLSDSKRYEGSHVQQQKEKILLQKHADYESADYERALLYKSSRSYEIKNYDDTYIKLKLNEDTSRLKYFGLGIYFYIEFMRRICWLLLLFVLLDALRIYLSLQGTGLSEYSQSFSTYLIKSTLGNYDKKILTAYDSYIMAFLPALLFAILAIFSLCWKCHFNAQIQEEQQNDTYIKPQKFCLEVQMDSKSRQSVTEKDLMQIFQNFGQVHEISFVKCYKNKLHYFEKIQELIQQVKDIELELQLSRNKDEGLKQEINQLNKQKEKIKDKVKELQIKPEVISAYVHYQYEKNKVDCLRYFNNNYLFNQCSHNLIRGCCSCCLDKINHKNPIYIKNSQVPEPQDINWEHFQLSSCHQMCRIFFGLMIILIFLAFSCMTIGLCTIYISVHSSDCDNVVIPISVADALISTDPKAKTCFCNANLFASLSDSSIKAYCDTQLNIIYVEQGIQYAIIVISTITNILFGFIVDKIINCIRPLSESQGLKYKTLVFTVFIIFNTIFLPLLLYSQIFGFKVSSYFSFLTLISKDIQNIFRITELELYIDYHPIWYRNVSPIYTNFIILDCLIVWLMFIVSKCKSGVQSFKQKQGDTIQKRMNREITAYQFNVYKEHSAFLMIFTMVLFFSPAIPILLPIGFINILSRYITTRSLLQNNSIRIKGLGIKFNEIVLTILPILLIISCLNACWIITANTEIYSSVTILKLSISKLNQFSILDRELYFPVYIGISLLVFIENYVIGAIITFCCCFCTCCKKQKIVIISSETKSFIQHKKKMNILSSYNIKSNDKMRNAVARMQEYIKRN